MNQWILVLGANSDIATATAHAFAKEGYNIYLASRTMETLKTLQSDIKIRYEVDCESLSLDISRSETHQAFYQALPVKPFGVIASFGSMHEQADAQKDFTLVKEMVEVNYLGAMSILEICAADLEIRKEGFIVGVSSVAGDRGRKTNYLYGSTKAAFTAYLSGLRNRLFGSGVQVLTVKPGFVATKMTEGLALNPKLTAQPQEVAQAILKAVKKKKDKIYTKKIWFFIMLIILHIPEKIFKRLSL